MKIRVSDGTNTIIFELNETSAAKSLYQMLPLKVTVENYSNNEKIFYPLGQPAATVACISSAKP